MTNNTYIIDYQHLDSVMKYTHYQLKMQKIQMNSSEWYWYGSMINLKLILIYCVCIVEPANEPFKSQQCDTFGKWMEFENFKWSLRIVIMINNRLWLLWLSISVAAVSSHPSPVSGAQAAAFCLNYNL